MEKYIHLNYILRYLREIEGMEFKILKSEDYDIKGIKGFRVIIPRDFEVESVHLIENFEDCLYNFEILNKDGVNAIDGPHIILWNSELYSTKKEEYICVSESSINDGLLCFEGFNKVPLFVGSKDILKYM